MERHLDEALKKLEADLLKMGSLAERVIHNTIEALKHHDVALAEQTILDEEKIDEFENSIEEHAIEILALFQPMAVDLRFITTAMRVNGELERISDLAVNICQRVKQMQKENIFAGVEGEIMKLSDIAKWMVTHAIDAFVNHNEEQSERIILRDQEANDLRTDIVKELVDKYLVKSGRNAPAAVALLLIARDLERICDQAKYIAEDVIYMVHAKVVKHHPERLLTDEKNFPEI